MRFNVLLSAIFLFPAEIFASPSQRQLSMCRACEKLAVEVERRLDETAKKGGQVTVGHRFGPNGESVHKKVIDYVDSENRYMDVFEDGLCAKNPHKNECYEFFDDNESRFHDWFFRKEKDSFLEDFCFKSLKGCSKATLEEALRKEEEKKAEEKLNEEKEKEAPAKSEPKPENQVIMDPVAEVQKLLKEQKSAKILHSSQDMNTNTGSDQIDPQACYFISIPKVFFVYAGAALLIVVILLAAYFAVSRLSAAREPLERPKRRRSYKML